MNKDSNEIEKNIKEIKIDEYISDEEYENYNNDDTNEIEVYNDKLVDNMLELRLELVDYCDNHSIPLLDYLTITNLEKFIQSCT